MEAKRIAEATLPFHLTVPSICSLKLSVAIRRPMSANANEGEADNSSGRILAANLRQTHQHTHAHSQHVNKCKKCWIKSTQTDRQQQSKGKPFFYLMCGCFNTSYVPTVCRFVCWSGNICCCCFFLSHFNSIERSCRHHHHYHLSFHVCKEMRVLKSMLYICVFMCVWV